MFNMVSFDDITGRINFIVLVERSKNYSIFPNSFDNIKLFYLTSYPRANIFLQIRPRRTVIFDVTSRIKTAKYHVIISMLKEYIMSDH